MEVVYKGRVRHDIDHDVINSFKTKPKHFIFTIENKYAHGYDVKIYINALKNVKSCPVCIGTICLDLNGYKGYREEVIDFLSKQLGFKKEGSKLKNKSVTIFSI